MNALPFQSIMLAVKIAIAIGHLYFDNSVKIVFIFLCERFETDIVHFKRLCSGVFHDLFSHYRCFFSKQNEYCKTEA